jgi:hypothetical protein
MGYAPPPPFGSHRVHRSIRAFLRELPTPGSLFLWKSIETQMSVLPAARYRRDGWEWRVELCYDGRTNPSAWSQGGSWGRPRLSEVRGWCRDQGEAWAAARAATNLVRERWAEFQSVAMRSHTERVPL